jgi:enamine deaminase RidA (YjgF/YER057c/UK114 family)
MELINPEGWARARGYSNVAVAEGRQVFIAGQIGWDPRTQAFAPADYVAEVRQTFVNLVEAVAAAGGTPEHIAAMSWYITDAADYLANAREIGRAYKEVIGTHLPSMTMVQVTALLLEGARVEINATAVIPPA